MRAGKCWVFDNEKREVLSLPPRTPVVISGVQERFLDFARNDDTRKALSSETRNLKAGMRDEWLVTSETLRLLPHTVIPSAAEGSPLQAGKRWVFDDEKREVLSLPPRTPAVITRVQERFLDFAQNDDTEKALSSETRNLKAGMRDEWLVPRETLRLLPSTVIPSAAEGSPLQTGKRWMFDDEKREVLSLPPRAPAVISGVQERFLGNAFNDDTGKALFSEPRSAKSPLLTERAFG